MSDQSGHFCPKLSHQPPPLSSPPQQSQHRNCLTMTGAGNATFVAVSLHYVITTLMKSYSPVCSIILVAMLLMGCVWTKTTYGAALAPEFPIPQSIFTISNDSPDPFFPHREVVKPGTDNSNNVLFLVLNGITSPPRATAMINGRTLEVGEEGEVKSLAGGKIRIKCEQISAESAVILIKGLRHELRLRRGRD
jgi:hypothetical protein